MTGSIHIAWHYQMPNDQNSPWWRWKFYTKTTTKKLHQAILPFINCLFTTSLWILAGTFPWRQFHGGNAPCECWENSLKRSWMLLIPVWISTKLWDPVSIHSCWSDCYGLRKVLSLSCFLQREPYFCLKCMLGFFLSCSPCQTEDTHMTISSKRTIINLLNWVLDSHLLPA